MIGKESVPQVRTLGSNLVVVARGDHGSALSEVHVGDTNTCPYPRSTGALGGPVRFTATLSEARAWTVDVLDAAGNRVAGGSGTTKAVD